MKKFLSILLIALLLCGGVSVGLSAAAAPVMQASSLLDPLLKFIDGNDLASLTEKQLDALMLILKGLKALNIDYAEILKLADDTLPNGLPITVKAALHKAGLMNYPIWERDLFFNFIFKWFLFGWAWM